MSYIADILDSECIDDFDRYCDGEPVTDDHPDHVECDLFDIWADDEYVHDMFPEFS